MPEQIKAKEGFFRIKTRTKIYKKKGRGKGKNTNTEGCLLLNHTIDLLCSVLSTLTGSGSSGFQTWVLPSSTCKC